MADPLPAPIIVSAVFGARDHAWFDSLRRAHFPLERNQLAAHLTLFHHLAPSLATELDHALDDLTRHRTAPAASAAALMNLGRGVAIRIRSERLVELRADLADRFDAVLTPQDRAGWRPHVTIQNKVLPAQARTLIAQLEADFVERPIEIAGLASWYYRAGPWELRRMHRFDRVRD